MSATPSFIGTIKTPTGVIANADATNFKSIITAGAAGSRVDALFITNSDAANPYVLQLAVQVSGVDYGLGEVTIPAGAGTNGSTKSVAALNSTDIPGLATTENGALYLQAGAVLRVRSKTTVSGVNTLQICGVAGDY